MRQKAVINALRVGLISLGLAVVGVLYVFPLYWLVATSLKSKAELYASTGKSDAAPAELAVANELFAALVMTSWKRRGDALALRLTAP